MERLAKLLSMHESNPDDADLPYMIAQEHANADDHRSAVEWYDRCLGVDPAYLYAYFHKARSLEALGDADGAADVARAGLARPECAANAKATSELQGLLDLLDA